MIPRTCVKICLATQPLKEAAAVMLKHNVSSLVVLQEDKKSPETHVPGSGVSIESPVGILSFKDLTRAAYTDEGKNMKTVADVMSTKLATISAELDVGEAGQKCKDEGCHHLIVVDKHGTFIGFLSTMDIARQYALNGLEYKKDILDLMTKKREAESCE